MVVRAWTNFTIKAAAFSSDYGSPMAYGDGGRMAVLGYSSGPFPQWLAHGG